MVRSDNWRNNYNKNNSLRSGKSLENQMNTLKYLTNLNHQSVEYRTQGDGTSPDSVDRHNSVRRQIESVASQENMLVFTDSQSKLGNANAL